MASRQANMKRKIRILSLDGGGIRGILPGVILAFVEEELQKRTSSDRRLADFFELIAGTSTGGILACGYLCPHDSQPLRSKFTAREVLDIYLGHGGEIFAASTLQQFRSLGGVTDERYQADVLEAKLKELFGDTYLSQLLKPCLIPAYDIRNRRTKFFDTTDGAFATGDFLVRDVARATSAAPTYFEAASVKSKFQVPHALIDGGVFANDPTMCAYAEARSLDFSAVLGPEFPKNPSAKDMMILSLGTGKEMRPFHFEHAKDWGKVGWVNPLLEIMMSAASEVVGYQVRQMFQTLESDRDYYRLDPELHDASPDMDDVSRGNIIELEVAGRKYVQDHEKELIEIVERLIELDEPEDV